MRELNFQKISCQDEARNISKKIAQFIIKAFPLPGAKENKTDYICERILPVLGRLKDLVAIDNEQPEFHDDIIKVCSEMYIKNPQRWKILSFVNIKKQHTSFSLKFPKTVEEMENSDNPIAKSFKKFETLVKKYRDIISESGTKYITGINAPALVAFTDQRIQEISENFFTKESKFTFDKKHKALVQCLFCEYIKQERDTSLEIAINEKLEQEICNMNKFGNEKEKITSTPDFDRILKEFIENKDINEPQGISDENLQQFFSEMMNHIFRFFHYEVETLFSKDPICGKDVGHIKVKSEDFENSWNLSLEKFRNILYTIRHNYFLIKLQKIINGEISPYIGKWITEVAVDLIDKSSGGHTRFKEIFQYPDYNMLDPKEKKEFQKDYFTPFIKALITQALNNETEFKIVPAHEIYVLIQQPYKLGHFTP